MPVRATEAVKRAVHSLGERRSAEEVRAPCEIVRVVETENDRLLRRATARLFKEENDPKQLIKWNDIYQDIEEAIDRCHDVANLIERVAVETA